MAKSTVFVMSMPVKCLGEVTPKDGRNVVEYGCSLFQKAKE